MLHNIISLVHFIVKCTDAIMSLFVKGLKKNLEHYETLKLGIPSYW